jgi:hypothetical protein
MKKYTIVIEPNYTESGKRGSYVIMPPVDYHNGVAIQEGPRSNPIIDAVIAKPTEFRYALISKILGICSWKDVFRSLF